MEGPRAKLHRMLDDLIDEGDTAGVLIIREEATPEGGLSMKGIVPESSVRLQDLLRQLRGTADG